MRLVFLFQGSVLWDVSPIDLTEAASALVRAVVLAQRPNRAEKILFGTKKFVVADIYHVIDEREIHFHLLEIR